MIDWRIVSAGALLVAEGLAGLGTMTAGLILDKAPIAVLGGMLFGWTLASLRRRNG